MALSADYQFEYLVQYSGALSSTLKFGAGTNIDIMSISGLEDLDVRVGDREFTRNHGDIPGEHYSTPRSVTFELAFNQNGEAGLLSDADYRDLIESALHQHFLVRPDFKADEQLSFRMPGNPDRMIRARTIKRTYPRRAEQEWGYARASVMFRASDPRIYSLAETDSGAQSATFNITNNGKANVYPILTFVHAGAVELTNNTYPITFAATGLSGTGLVADFDRYIRGERGLIVYDGSTNEYGKWTHPRRAFVLGPGVNSLTLTTGTSVALVTRDAWI